MPPRTKITREMIVEAGFELIRREGLQALNARALARELSCSTQPILYHFPSMEEVRLAIYQAADAFHSSFLLSGSEEKEDPLLSMGLSYLRFAKEEGNLFRFLFLTGQFAGKNARSLLEDASVKPILELVQEQVGGSLEEARLSFLPLFLCVHGYACLIAAGSLDYDEDLARELLSSLYASTERR